MDLGLNGRVAVVLASSKGLGRGCAEALAAEGCRLALCARGAEALEAAAEEIRRETGAEVFARAIDVRAAEDRKSFLDAVLGEYGAVDVLVANCGGPPPGRGLDLTDGQWEEAVRSTLMVSVDWARAVAPGMVKRRRGSIVFLTSISVKQPIDGLILSNTMRAGVAGFAKTLANELAPSGVRVNAVCPGTHRTDRLTALAQSRAKAQGTTVEEQWRRMEAEVPMGRLGNPREFGDVVAFLASERASYLTGATIQIDGGLYRGLL